MKIPTGLALVLSFGLGTAACAQPPLTSLWPGEDGKRWEFEYGYALAGEPEFQSPAFLQLEGQASTAGGPAQVLLAGHDLPPARAGEPTNLSPLHLAIWHARPDLRAAVEQRCGKSRRTSSWFPILLHDGYFMKSAASIQMWQPDWDHPTWTYLTSDLSIGAQFTHQLIPELAPDVYLHGTVSSITDAVTTPAGSFTGVVKITYLIDYGINTATDESGNVVGRCHSETRGHVRYCPEIGPVDMLEEYVPYVWIDCAPLDCPPEWVAGLGAVVETQTLALSSFPLREESLSWSGIKALYR